MEFKKKLLCIGAGYVGGPTMAVIAQKCPDHKVTVVDIDAAKIKAWQSGNLPIYEPGLADLVASILNKNLFFSIHIAQEINEADIIFVAVNTPTKDYGEGAGQAADLRYWEKTAHQIVKYSDNNKIIVEKSTLPVRTAEAMERILNSNDKNLHFDVISNPEFLAEGTALYDLEKPDRVLIGSRETPEGLKARKTLLDVYAYWVPSDKIVESNVWSAELSKLTSNAFLSQRISSINSISALCEATEANIQEVAYAVGKDHRIGPHFLNSSVGFGGSCFKKDILNLVYICRTLNLPEVADYWDAVIKVNDWQQKRFVQNMLKNMFNTVAEKKIVILGFAFKAQTADTRESPAISVCKNLLLEKAYITISDPKALENAKRDLKDYSGIEYEQDPYKACENADAIAILTEWEDFKRLDYNRILKSVKKPALIFDGRNILNRQELYKLGYNVFSIGCSPLLHY